MTMREWCYGMEKEIWAWGRYDRFRITLTHRPFGMANYLLALAPSERWGTRYRINRKLNERVTRIYKMLKRMK